MSRLRRGRARVRTNQIPLYPDLHTGEIQHAGSKWLAGCAQSNAHSTSTIAVRSSDLLASVFRSDVAVHSLVSQEKGFSAPSLYILRLALKSDEVSRCTVRQSGCGAPCLRLYHGDFLCKEPITGTCPPVPTCLSRVTWFAMTIQPACEHRRVWCRRCKSRRASGPH